jgi:hypothetical protein
LIVSAEKVQTLIYRSIDRAGNQEADKSLTISIDKTPPTITGSRSPAANGAGWNNADVTVRFTCADALSGVDTCTQDQLVSTEGANQSVTGTAVDKAGNSATAAISSINIDKTPPTTSVNPNPVANAQGWNKTDVTVTLSATDSLSGVAKTEYNLDSAGWAAYTAPIAITTEKAHTLLYRSLDVARNQEVDKTLVVRIDKTTPEASLQFDPASKDPVLIGKDGMSGAPAGPIKPTSVVPTQWLQEDEDALKGTAESAEYQALLKQLIGQLQDAVKTELRTYVVSDAAGNSLEVVVKARTLGRSIRARVVSLRYGGGQATTPVRNGIGVAWSVGSDGSIKALVEGVGAGQGKDRHIVLAGYDSTKGVTNLITIDGVLPSIKYGAARRAGLVVLRVSTSKGQVTAEY